MVTNMEASIFIFHLNHQDWSTTDVEVGLDEREELAEPSVHCLDVPLLDRIDHESEVN